MSGFRSFVSRAGPAEVKSVIESAKPGIGAGSAWIVTVVATVLKLLVAASGLTVSRERLGVVPAEHDRGDRHLGHVVAWPETEREPTEPVPEDDAAGARLLREEHLRGAVAVAELRSNPCR